MASLRVVGIMMRARQPYLRLEMCKCQLFPHMPHGNFPHFPLASLGIMEAFLEDISSAKKKESEGILNATSKMKEFQQRLVASSYSKQRLGPLLNAGTNLAIALESVEEYYTDVAEYSAEQCTSECSFVFYFLLAYLTWSPFV